MLDTFMRRLVGAAMLDAATYEDVEADRLALPQAVAVVVLASIAAGVGARGMRGSSEAVSFMVSGSVLALIAWATWAALMYQIGVRLWPQPETSVDLGQLLRTLGFAAAPGLIQVFAVFPGMTIPVFAVATAWTLAASVLAVKHALDYSSTMRAVAVSGLGWAIALATAFVIGLAGSTVVLGH